MKKASGVNEKIVVFKLAEKINLLWDVDKHYHRKENLLFPYLEKYDISGPPKVMWGVDDEIRGLLKELKSFIQNYQIGVKEQLIGKTEEALHRITEMIFKEEKILFPMALETLAEDEWYHIYEDSDEIGYCLVEPHMGWHTETEQYKKIADEETAGNIRFKTGVLTPGEISMLFDHLPVDITFVDKEGIVKYFSNAKDRIFPRTRTIIGRKVENCHPPTSIDKVEQLVADLKSGKKDRDDFWIKMDEKYVLISYFAIRDEQNNFTGIMEVTQNIKPIQGISGEKRIMD